MPEWRPLNTMPFGLTKEEQERWREKQRAQFVRPYTAPFPPVEEEVAVPMHLPARLPKSAVPIDDPDVIEGEYEVPGQIITAPEPYDETWAKGDVLKYRRPRRPEPVLRLSSSRTARLVGLDPPVYEPDKWVVCCLYRKRGHRLRTAILKSLPPDRLALPPD